MPTIDKSQMRSIADELYKLTPQEMLVKTPDPNRKPLSIGIPKESSKYEKRIALRPESVAVLVANGIEVWIESGAGDEAKYFDREFNDVGAKIVYSAEEAFKADIVLKIAPPTLEEIEYMRQGKTLISALQTSTLTPDLLHALNRKEITGLAFEFIEDKVGGLPIVRSMSEISGSTVMLIAAEYLSSANDGRGIILGGVTGVPPSRVVILGAGTVAEYAARIAIGMGAEVKIFDNHIYKLRRIKQRLGQHHIYTSTIDMLTLMDALSRADIAIGALRSDDGRSPCVVTEEMVAKMKPDSIIIDVSVDQGGCFETSEVTNHLRPAFRKYDVIHYCVPNIASRVAHTATTALANIFTPILIQVHESGGVDQMMYENQWFAKGVYAYRGGITNKGIAQKYNLKYKNLNLIIAASF